MFSGRFKQISIHPKMKEMSHPRLAWQRYNFIMVTTEAHVAPRKLHHQKLTPA
ncbi:rCG62917 [Rattus norvegicus]|uniref:RCG62917 n=1 Tax=Rattus norvegicus TaxID=10116 RepID=A6KPV1_RAT|nr:rCG62917 [Rattus norvegicus]